MARTSVEASLYSINPNVAMRGSDRKSTRLNSSHSQISYAVFCLKKNNSLHKQASEKPSLIREKASDVTILLATPFDAHAHSSHSIMLSAVTRLVSIPHLRLIHTP